MDEVGDGHLHMFIKCKYKIKKPMRNINFFTKNNQKEQQRNESQLQQHLFEFYNQQIEVYS